MKKVSSVACFAGEWVASVGRRKDKLILNEFRMFYNEKFTNIVVALVYVKNTVKCVTKDYVFIFDDGALSSCRLKFYQANYILKSYPGTVIKTLCRGFWVFDTDYFSCRWEKGEFESFCELLSAIKVFESQLEKFEQQHFKRSWTLLK